MGVFPTLLFGQTVTGLYDAHNQLVGGLPHGNWFVISMKVDNDTVIPTDFEALFLLKLLIILLIAIPK